MEETIYNRFEFLTQSDKPEVTKVSITLNKALGAGAFIAMQLLLFKKFPMQIKQGTVKMEAGNLFISFILPAPQAEVFGKEMKATMNVNIRSN